jgi:uridylate kinase
MKKGRGRGPENRCTAPSLAWNQVDAISVATRVPICAIGCFQPFFTTEGWTAVRQT